MCYNTNDSDGYHSTNSTHPLFCGQDIQHNRGTMVNRCINTHCGEELRLFGSGELYSLETKGEANSEKGTEFFWLCSSCVSRFTVRLDPMGRAEARLKSEVGYAQPPDANRDLRMAFCSAKCRIWSKTGPLAVRSDPEMDVEVPLGAICL